MKRKLWWILGVMLILGCGDSGSDNTETDVGNGGGAGNDTSDTVGGGEDVANPNSDATQTTDDMTSEQDGVNGEDTSGTTEDSGGVDDVGGGGDQDVSTVEGPGLIPKGTWLLKADYSTCEDAGVPSSLFGLNRNGVLTVAGNGTATLQFYDQSFQQFVEMSFNNVDKSTEGVYLVKSAPGSIEESVNCKINTSYGLNLKEVPGGLEGTFDYAEIKKGGGCFTDGCEGGLSVTATKLGQPANPFGYADPFDYYYENTKDAVTDVATMAIYPDDNENYPYFWTLDIYTPGALLQTIRGRKYIVTSDDVLRGRAFEYVYDAEAGCINHDVWDIKLTMITGQNFGGELEHTLNYHYDCQDKETIKSIGTMTWGGQ
ncbi:MAG: hypothetical protein HUU55_03895 [Myxococcales bacterium]|nr:hypothetical protein [Myxococcales bacterium]